MKETYTVSVKGQFDRAVLLAAIADFIGEYAARPDRGEDENIVTWEVERNRGSQTVDRTGKPE